MVCLSWAASILQAHKRDHWTLAQAIDFSLDPSASGGSSRWTGRPPNRTRLSRG
jgi:hypothetical protein